jgi:enoyl-CoA hydratase/carnithine racemase
MKSRENLTRRDHGDGVIELVLGRAPVNALSAAFLMDFADEIQELGQDDTVRSIVITSDFKVFSAGLDLREAQTFDLKQQNAIVEGLNVGFLKLFSCPKPTVCAINGAAIAGGLFFILASDLRVSNSKASFGLAEVRVGADFPVGPLEIARATLDPNMLRRLMLTGLPISAETAHHMGIVDVLDETPTEKAIAEARKLGKNPPKTYASIKRQIRGGTIAVIEHAIENHASEEGWFSDETKTAMQRMIG